MGQNNWDTERVKKNLTLLDLGILFIYENKLEGLCVEASVKLGNIKRENNDKLIVEEQERWVDYYYTLYSLCKSEISAREDGIFGLGPQ